MPTVIQISNFDSTFNMSWHLCVGGGVPSMHTNVRTLVYEQTRFLLMFHIL